MPSSDVELEVEYFTRATLTAEPAAAEPTEGTDAALLTAGTSEEGTLFYALSSQD
ncbi:MAG: hypothetical protein IKH32_10880 [Prevotella sp.]|nr:hypothetical protein [Prevotella sp.]